MKRGGVLVALVSKERDDRSHGDVAARADDDLSARAPLELQVTKEFRAWVTAFPLEKVEYLDLTLEIRGVIEGVVRAFRKALVENKPGLYRPWTQKNSKWAG